VLRNRETLGTGGVPGCIFCCGRFGWPTECSGVGAGIGSEGAFSGSAGLVAIVCVWQVWLFMKSGQVSCCNKRPAHSCHHCLTNKYDPMTVVF
jgi:hypothetical protein